MAENDIYITNNPSSLSNDPIYSNGNGNENGNGNGNKNENENENGGQNGGQNNTLNSSDQGQDKDKDQENLINYKSEKTCKCSTFKLLETLETEISSFTVSQDLKILAICLMNNSMKLFKLDLNSILNQEQEIGLNSVSFEKRYPLHVTLEHSKKIHEAPVLTLDFHKKAQLLATGSADSTVKVWDANHGHATHNFKGESSNTTNFVKGHRGIITVVKFHPVKMILVSGSDDCSVRIWDLMSKSTIAVLDSHVSVVKGISFTRDGEGMFTAGRDRIFNRWCLATNKLIYTIPVHESLESIAIFPLTNGEEVVVTGGDRGVIRVWGAATGELMVEEDKQPGAAFTISNIICENGGIMAVTSEQNLVFYSFEGDGLKEIKVIAGYNHEILDLALLGDDDSHLAVITNSNQVRVYDIATRDCRVIYGHVDIILAASASFDGKYLITGSKDTTAKLWSVTRDTALDNRRLNIKEVSTFVGHTGSVSAVRGLNTSNRYFLTAAQDRTVKCWQVVDGLVKSRYTFQAHEGDVQCIDVSPNDVYFATSSLDKTAKMWKVDDGSLVGVFKGHKRGVWKVQFSPVDQTLITASTDKTIKIWNINDFTCMRTFEGHLNSVLSVQFVTHGLQFLSTGSDGLMKLWNVKDGECVDTFDNHTDRVWSLCVGKGEELVYTGSSDSTVTVWRDISTEVLREKEGREEELMTRQQDLAIFLQRKDYKNAIVLALMLKQPFKLLNIFHTLLRERPDPLSVLGATDVDEYVSTLDVSLTHLLLTYIRDWNTNSKHAKPANLLLNLILSTKRPQMLNEMPGSRELFEGLLVYCERHLEHAAGLIKDNYLVEYTLDRMEALL